MTEDLTLIVGTDVASASTRAILSAFVALEPIVLDFAPDEGMPKEYFLSSKAEGICIKHEHSGEIRSVFLMSEGRDGYSQYRGPLPAGLTWTTTIEHVGALLGAPSFSRSSRPGPFPHGHGAIVRFDRPTYSLHLQFKQNAPGLEMITLMSPNAVPR